MKKIFIWIGSIFLIFFIAYQFWNWSYYKNYYSGMKFSKEAWIGDRGRLALGGKKSSSVYASNIRCKMYDDIVKNYLKKGMKLQEAEKILGKSSLRYYCFGKEVKCIKYLLGVCYANSLTLSHGDLVICANKNHDVIDFGRAHKLDKKYSSKGRIYCDSPSSKCECYIKDKANGEDCDFEVERW